MKLVLVLAPLALAGMLTAQTPRTVTASGDAVISVKPDLARVTVGVETQAVTAQEAAAQNATIAQNVLTAVRGVLGSGGTTETISYTISPNYRSAAGQPPVLTGYTVTNLIQVTTLDMGNVGRLIDAASGAGANRINGLSFGIRDEDPVRRQALTAAAKQARGHADAIAAGLGGRAGMVLERAGRLRGGAVLNEPLGSGGGNADAHRDGTGGGARVGGRTSGIHSRRRHVKLTPRRAVIPTSGPLNVLIAWGLRGWPSKCTMRLPNVEQTR